LRAAAKQSLCAPPPLSQELLPLPAAALLCRASALPLARVCGDLESSTPMMLAPPPAAALPLPARERVFVRARRRCSSPRVPAAGLCRWLALERAASQRSALHRVMAMLHRAALLRLLLRCGSSHCTLLVLFTSMLLQEGRLLPRAQRACWWQGDASGALMMEAAGGKLVMTHD
jgi:hypothetical protein